MAHFHSRLDNIESQSTAVTLLNEPRPKKRRADYVHDLWRSFGESAEHPNVKIYENLPGKKLVEFARRATALHAHENRAAGLGYAGLAASGLAVAMDFKIAAVGFMAVTAAATYDFLRGQRAQARLHQEILTFKKE